jgi:diguanylate cyclase (GGDEF)-like protein
LLEKAIALDLTSDIKEALETAELAYEVALQEADMSTVVLAAHRLASMHFNADSLEEGIKVCLRAVQWLPYCQDEAAIVSFDAVYGGLLVAIGDVDAGFERLAACNRSARSLSDPMAAWRALTAYAVALFDTDAFEAARLSAAEALDYARSRKLPRPTQRIAESIKAWTAARVLGEQKLSGRDVDVGLLAATEEDLSTLLIEARANDLTFETVEYQSHLGLLAFARGDDANACARFTAASMTNSSLGNELLEYDNCYWHALVLSHNNLFREAWRLIARIETLAAMRISSRRRSRFHKLASLVAEGEGYWQLALVHHKKFHEAELVEHERLRSARSHTTQISLDLEALKHLRDQERIDFERLLEENLRLQNHSAGVENDARTDPLTGLGNRRALRFHCDEWIAKGVSTAALLLIDADHFKSVNDRFGHDAGDLVLCRFATILSQSTADTVAIRMGGEEFLLVLLHADSARAIATAEGILAQVRSLSFPEIGDLQVTCSIGISLWNTGDDFDDALKDADGRLYQAKRTGRNRWIN